MEGEDWWTQQLVPRLELGSVEQQPVCFRVGAGPRCLVSGWQSCPQPGSPPGAAGGLTPAPLPQAHLPHWSTGQPHPTATSPGHRGCCRPSSSPGMDPAPQQLGRTSALQQNSHPPSHQAGEPAAPVSSNKGQRAAKHWCGLSGGGHGSASSHHAQGRFVSIPHAAAESSPCPTLSQCLCWPLTTSRFQEPCLALMIPELLAPTGVWWSRRMRMLSWLLLKVAGNGDLSGEGSSRTRLSVKSKSHPEPAGCCP